jgi:hypothetical protein
VVEGFTEVTGIIHSNIAWTKENSPYVLTGPLSVENGLTLTIEPGATINLNSYYIEVAGTLVSKGTNAEPIHMNNGTIYFTSVSPSWNEQTGSGSLIENSILNLTIININNTSPKINNNSISNGHINGQEGSFIISNNNIVGNYSPLIVADLGSPKVLNNTITCDNNHHIGISAAGGNATISNNNIEGGGEYGIRGGQYVSGNIVSGFQTGIYASYATVAKNLVKNNYRGLELAWVVALNNTIINNSVGIYVDHSDTIKYNNFQNNSCNVYLDKYGEATVDATYNWWGTTETKAINQSIYDFKNDFNLGLVTFVPFLAEPNPQAMHDPNAPLPTSMASPSLTPTVTLSPSPTIPEMTPAILISVLAAITCMFAVAVAKKKLQLGKTC